MSDVRIGRVVERVSVVCGQSGLRTAQRAKIPGNLTHVSA